jgi:hypothetical protein
MVSRSPSKNPRKPIGIDGPVRCFISHRCNEYDNAIWRKSFEKFLIKLNITPVYGCDLDATPYGILGDGIENAMKKSEMFFAVITPSWLELNEISGWPKREWEMWQVTHGGSGNKKRCMGFLFNVNRESIEFNRDLRTYSVSWKTFKFKKQSVFSSLFTPMTPLFGSFEVHSKDYDIIVKRLNAMVEDALDARLHNS